MANWVFSAIRIVIDDSEVAQKLQTLLTSDEESDAELIERTLEQLGAKPEVKEVLFNSFRDDRQIMFARNPVLGNQLVSIEGYSKWSPPRDFLAVISEIFRCEVRCVYVDSLFPFAGCLKLIDGECKKHVYYEETKDAVQMLIDEVGIDRAMECWSLDPADKEARELFEAGNPPCVMVW